MTTEFDSLWNDAAVTLTQTVYGEAVTLRRGSVSTSGVIAQKLLGERTVDYGDGGTTKLTGCDWIIAKDAYLVSSAAVTPRTGDRIIESDGSEWELAPVESSAEYSEQPGGEEWLVSTKRVKV